MLDGLAVATHGGLPMVVPDGGLPAAVLAAGTRSGLPMEEPDGGLLAAVLVGLALGFYERERVACGEPVFGRGARRSD
jgi:hypothetical protein